MQPAPDPAISSHYVNNELYRKLVEDLRIGNARS